MSKNPVASSFAQALLTHARLLLLPEETSPSSRRTSTRSQYALTIQANLEGLGFGLQPDALRALMAVPEATQVALYAQALPTLRDLVGVRAYTPFYPNFPKQVMEASDVELLVNALILYTGDVFGLRLVPDYPKEKRPPLREKTTDHLKPLGVVTPNQAVAVWQQWTQATVAWSPAMREAAVAGLEWVMASDTPESQRALRELTVPNRENKAVLAAAVLRLSQGKLVTDAGWMHPSTKQPLRAMTTLAGVPWPLPGTTATDVLRTAAAFSGGDPSLAEPTKLVSFSRPVRRALMALAEEGSTSLTAEEDMFARREAWLRLGERLHPGEFKGYPTARYLFERVRNEAAPLSFMARLDAAVSTDVSPARVALVLPLFQERPGLAARQLRRVLVWAGAKHAAAVLDAFQAHADEVSTSVLLNVAHAFGPQVAGQPRTVLPKGQIGRMMITPKPADVVPQPVADRAKAIAEQALIQRFRQLPALGKVYVDPALDRVPTPFALRSASKALHTLPRGAKGPMDPKAAVTRLFVWWNERKPDGTKVDRTDLDLSCVVYDKNFKQLVHCAFTDLRSNGLTHSGDMTSAPNGASEFIDVEHALLPKGSRYIGMVVTCYTGQHYSELPECFAGWMTRRSPRSGEVYEPRTVAQRFDLTCDSKAIIPMVMDLDTREFIWLDMPYHAGHSYNAVALQGEAIGERIRELAHLSRPTLGALFALHVAARGTRVAHQEEADVALTLAPQTEKPGVCATDVALSSQWMADAGAEGWAPPVKEDAPKARRRRQP